MKTHEEIKKGLECCCDNVSCMKCTYYDRRDRKYACETALLADALAYIQQLEAQVPKWISVEERLPKNEKPVLVATKWSLMGMRGMAVSCGFYTDGKTSTGNSDYNWNDGDCDLIYDEEEDEYIVPEGWWESVRYTEQFSAIDEPVTHWMPLPEPPKEG